MAIIETGPSTEPIITPMVTITKEEYDALQKDAVKLDLLLEALFARATLTACNDGLHFNDIDEVMTVLYPEACGNVIQLLKEAEHDRLREEQGDE